MHYSEKIPIISKIISIKRNGIEIRYQKKQLYMPFSDVHDIRLIKSRAKEYIFILNTLILALIAIPILFYSSLDEPFIITIYGIMLLILIAFKSRRFEQAYYITIILTSGKNYRIKIKHKDRLDVIRERLMQELFLERENAVNSTAS